MQIPAVPASPGCRSQDETVKTFRCRQSGSVMCVKKKIKKNGGDVLGFFYKKKQTKKTQSVIVQSSLMVSPEV